ncbi:condensin complex subunit 1-like, partial [Anoplophora glabripennis]|uniref:condensin complex subunit 1-like n=1 Tax=Anoplophora glabripennis TaxID=217634 RepID=UPI000C76BD68
MHVHAESSAEGSHEQDVEEQQDNRLSWDQMTEILKMYLTEGKYKEAFRLCKKSGRDKEEFRLLGENNAMEESEMYLLVFHSVFFDINKLVEEMRAGGTVKMTEEDFKRMEAMETHVDFLEDCVGFLRLIDNAIPIMIELLETTTIGDMHEAVEFFTSAYQFSIDNSMRGILAMLKIMQRNEQERRDCIINAFKTIYLNTDCTNTEEHCLTIVCRLIRLVKTVPLNNIDDFQLIISEWTAKGILDNSIIDMFWQYFTQKISCTEGDSHAATKLLRMCALGRKTIVTRNIKLVATVAFGERGTRDMQFLGSACELLSVAGREKIDITSKNPPYKIKPGDEIFGSLLEILGKKFFEPVEYYNKALFGGIDFIYK